jgi:hypothetical protein
VRFDVQVPVPGPPEDADVHIRFSLTNVMNRSDSSDYDGELRSTVVVRRTDREPFNGNPSDFVTSTTRDFPLEFTIPCVTTPGSSLDGSTCELTTTAKTLVPGMTPELRRTIWGLDQVRVYDGGPDGNADTAGDNSLFATQGVFIP